MPTRYAPLPNPRTDDDELDNEMEAAFDDPEDDEEQIAVSHPDASLDRRQDPLAAPSLGGFDFENVDYDYPPPGSPPPSSALALPNNHGNSNGLIPSVEANTSQTGPRRSWFKTAAAAILPVHYAQRLGLGPKIPTGPVGGGTNNDGVFANVTAKPSFALHSEPGESPYLVPEDSRQEAPPSYAVAQADAVPSYWETTIHAPFSPDHPGEIIIDELPTGTLFSFMWNMLVTVSFQFVGFLLTYLLHTTHAARLGSRAGLGIILIQYGFALRGKGDAGPIGINCPALSSAEPVDPSEAESLYKDLCGVDELRNEQLNKFIADATKQWLSFFLMTVGWFILLSSLVSFWRVKRWERGILASQRENASAVPPEASAVARGSSFDHLFGMRTALVLRQGLGFSWDLRESESSHGSDEHNVEDRLESGETRDSPTGPGYQEALANELRLRADLRAAGLI